MTTATTAKTTMRKRPVRRAVRQVPAPISDRRYYVQCGYRLAMAVIALVSLIIITANH